MDHRVDLVLAEDFVQFLLVQEIHRVALGLHAGDAGDALQHLGLGVAEVIDDDHLFACLDQLYHSVAADIAGAAGY